jgi:PAS domain S-box-containing protein
MEPLSGENEEVLRLFIVAAASIGAILTTIFSLTHGIFEVFPFLYILPIILAVYFYPRRAVIFSLSISLLYICLVYLLGAFDPSLIAVSTAWFAIFITLAVVASSYANQLLEEKVRIRHVLDTSQDGIFCFDLPARRIRAINRKCALWLDYDREELLGCDLAVVWADAGERERFLADVIAKETGATTEALFRRKDGGILRFIISAVLVTKNQIVCSAIDITDSKIADEEIRQTLEDLERQVRERTAHLERINEELRAEIMERRRIENAMLSGKTAATKKLPDEEERP